MTSTSAQFRPSENACRSSLEPVKQVRPKLPLLKVLHAAGAKGETFTLKECMIYLGEYIEGLLAMDDIRAIKWLLPGKVFSFFTCCLDAAQTLAFTKDQSEDNPSQDRLKQNNRESSFSTEQEDHEGDLSSLNHTYHINKEKEDGVLIDNLSKEQTTLDLLVEEWDVAGLPWWFLGNLRNNYKSRSNDSTDIHTNKLVLLLLFVQQDSWQCIKCKKFNSPIKRYCFRCWALRKDWFSDCPRLIQSMSTSNIATIHGKEDPKGIDVPDCRRTISAPIVRPKDLCSSMAKPNLSSKSSMDSLDLALGCEDKEPSLRFVKCTEKEVQPLENSKELLKPCLVCLKRPRNGNIVHGRTAHLVACFTCAKRLKKARSVCPVCKKQIQMVIKTFIT
ncbi:PREDICTED: protein Mdm4 [Thamnophis sirtalis]|uniref:Protein Mdm4 n=1 Tax=Thamnophis sirtalis TaxID=35019 RepID=A0A6I9Z7B1_9SAUR|nr:PREDICTED: protein Mdm4 [Thamnophis sirtalis]